MVSCRLSRGFRRDASTSNARLTPPSPLPEKPNPTLSPNRLGHLVPLRPPLLVGDPPRVDQAPRALPRPQARPQARAQGARRRVRRRRPAARDRPLQRRSRYWDQQQRLPDLARFASQRAHGTRPHGDVRIRQGRLYEDAVRGERRREEEAQGRQANAPSALLHTAAELLLDALLSPASLSAHTNNNPTTPFHAPTPLRTTPSTPSTRSTPRAMRPIRSGATARSIAS